MQGSKDCGNSPKNKFAQDVAVALECGEAEPSAFSEDVIWENPSTEPSSRKSAYVRLDAQDRLQRTPPVRDRRNRMPEPGSAVRASALHEQRRRREAFIASGTASPTALAIAAHRAGLPRTEAGAEMSFQAWTWMTLLGSTPICVKPGAA